MRNHRPLLAVLGLSLIICPASAFAKRGHKAHEHGVVNLSIAIDGVNVAISGEIPGDDAFGFEHTAKTDKEKQAVKDALATFRTKGTDLFVFSSDAGCSVKEANIKAAQESAEPIKSGEHADVDADYTFVCKKSPVGSTLKLGLLKAFPHIKTVHVQVISGTNQSGTTIHGADEAIKL